MSVDITPQAAFLARSVLQMMRPYDLLDTPLVRIGRNFDGGYIMAEKFDGVDTAYSLGINDDVSWDFDIAQRGIDIYQYDHTITNLPFEHSRFHWSKTGISNSRGENVDTLESLIEKKGTSRYFTLALAFCSARFCLASALVT